MWGSLMRLPGFPAVFWCGAYLGVALLAGVAWGGLWGAWWGLLLFVYGLGDDGVERVVNEGVVEKADGDSGGGAGADCVSVGDRV